MDWTWFLIGISVTWAICTEIRYFRYRKLAGDIFAECLIKCNALVREKERAIAQLEEAIKESHPTK